MPWLPEISRTSGADTPPPLAFYDGIRQLTPNALLKSWAGAPDLDTPSAGRISSAANFILWVDQTRTWLADSAAVVRPVYLSVEPGGRSFEEVAIDLTLDGERVECPVAIVTDRAPDKRIRAIRVYHSMWPLTHGHEIRGPLLPSAPDLAVPDVVGEYQRALAAADLEGVVALYEETAYMREPAGGEYVYEGRDAIRHIYSLAFADGAGISLEHCSLTDDGVAVALEYNCGLWGRTPIPLQAGVAVYQRGATGRLAAARIYDDVAPPDISDSSRTQLVE
ncbi:MAG TPA: nuclear transport factor 2 family protein [Candidatus Saccharimonadales bacterium]|nr:nuclear transport factor 2 family protein [Candidatus Saccharimonadales bacterium]